VITQSPHKMIRAPLEARGITAGYTILSVPPARVPDYLAASDFGLSFIKPCFSKLASSPTKIGEYLASGLPVLSNTEIGDTDEILKQPGVGVLVDSFTDVAYKMALAEMVQLLSPREAIQRRCREVAEAHLSLARTGRDGYLRAYRALGWIG
jgi:glycosyltransferase involved in cell wall biosynthesis